MRNIRDLGVVKPVHAVKPGGREQQKKAGNRPEAEVQPDGSGRREQQDKVHVDEYA